MSDSPPGVTATTAATAFDAVVVLSFGAPESRAEVMPFLRRVTAGRPVPPERLEQVAQHYYALGSVSPLNAQNRSLVAQLAQQLGELGVSVPIRLANRHSPEFLPPVLRELAGRGCQRILAVTTSGYSSYPGCRAYREDIAAAVAAVGATITVVKAPPLLGVPGFVTATTERLRQALSLLPDNADPRVLCTTHSLPTHDARSSGPPPHPRDPGEYVSQHLQVAQCVVDAIADRPSLRWELVYQSRSGDPRTPWLEPDINDRLRELAADGVRDVVVLPLGFLSDHMEVVWDLDTQAAATARELGIAMVRVPTVGTHPAFVASLARNLARLIRAADQPPVQATSSAGSGGSESAPAVQGARRGTLCGPDCCPSPRPTSASCDSVGWRTTASRTLEKGLRP